MIVAMVRPIRRSLAAFVLGVAAIAASASPIAITVHVPADTPTGDSVYLAGSLPAAGGWKADGVKLSRAADGTYAGSIDLQVGDSLEYKFNRGNWDTVEKNADGSERVNRELTVDAATNAIDATVDRWATPSAATSRPSTVVGHLQIVQTPATEKRPPRTLRVWLPEQAAASAGEKFPVLYMHDGQNLFDRASSAFGDEWQIDETLTKLIADKAIPPLIVVGIDNAAADRINEYTFVPDTKHGGGHADAYADLLLNVIMPFVQSKFPVLTGPANTYLGGSSLGGLVSLEIARKHVGVFGGVLAMSPSLWWADQAILKDLKADASPLANVRIWLDIGTLEDSPRRGDPQNQKTVDEAKQLDEILSAANVKHRLTIDDGARHNEAAWAKRFPSAIIYLTSQSLK